MTQTLSTTLEAAIKHRLNRHHRRIIKRIIVHGRLRLETPTCLGSGDADSPTDLPLLRDSVSDRALLTGASLAGALRNYLWEYEQGYGKREEGRGKKEEKVTQDNAVKDLAMLLFGGKRSDEDGDQSPLIVDDALSSQIPEIEIRDGVRIESATGTADDGAKYDLELLAAGTEFNLSFELLIDQEHDEAQLRQALALALRGLEKGEISIGIKKRRGFGRCKVDGWQAWIFDLKKDSGKKDSDLLKWLTFDHASPEITTPETSIEKALGLTIDRPDQRDRLCICATFKLDSPLLIRSEKSSSDRAPDVVHLKSHRNGLSEPQPILSGTSLTGVMKHRAERILNTLDKPPEILKQMLNQMFGFVAEKGKEDKESAKSSRLVIHESVVEGKTHDLVQNRIAIDRFTGGAYHGALFSEQPVFGTDETTVKLELELRNPEDPEIGLLLLLLKDLWTGDLPVGGGRSIGRGQLKGQQATIIRHNADSTIAKTWTIAQQGNSLEVSDAGALEAFVQALGSLPGEENP